MGGFFPRFMKISIITKRFHTNLYYTVKALQEAGHAVSLLVWGRGQSENHDIIEPFVIGYSAWSLALNRQINKIKSAAVRDFLKHKIPFINLEEMIDFKRLKNKLAEEKPDVILVRAYPNITFLLMIWLSVRACGRVFLMAQTAEHYGETLAKKIYLFVLKKILRVKGLITPLKNSLRQKDDFFIYLPFVIEAKHFHKEYFQNDKINIISVGKFVRRKDHLGLLQAVNGLKDKNNYAVTLLGEKVEEPVLQEIYDYIRANGLADIVDLKFNLPHEKVLSEYRHYDLFVLPSYGEPAAYSPLEAMAAKLPVIVSDTCGTKCYIKEGENGYIFASHDFFDLQDKIEKIAGDRENLKQMGEKAFKIAENEFSLKVFQDGFAEAADKI
jgi:glycosyltransferase involved in cell wall biosynthesis